MNFEINKENVLEIATELNKIGFVVCSMEQWQMLIYNGTIQPTQFINCRFPYKPMEDGGME